MTVTEEQLDLAQEKADALSTLLLDGIVSLLAGKSRPQEAMPILNRVKKLLDTVGVDTGAILSEALERTSLAKEIERVKNEQKATPLDFEEARDQMFWEPVFGGLRAFMRATIEAERQEQRRVHARWERHWRTRLARRLREWATRADLPEPVVTGGEEAK